MDSFLSQIKQLQNKIFQLNQFVDKLNRYHRKKLNESLSREEEEKLNSKIVTVEQIFRNDSNKIKAELKALKKENLKHKDEEDDFYDAREMQFRNVSKSFMDSLKSFWKVQMNYSKEERLKISKEFLIAKPEATKEEIDDFIKNKGKKTPFSISDENSSVLLDKINLRKQKMTSIAQNAMEIVELIKQMQIIVEEDSEMVENIYVNINVAEKDSEKANQNLTQALDAERRRMWWKRLITIIVVIIMVFLGAWGINTLMKIKKNSA